MTWVALWGIGIAVLFLALAYAAVRYATRNKANDAITEEATRELRENPRAYAHGGRRKLQRELRPD